jgi:hypothetical protein
MIKPVITPPEISLVAVTLEARELLGGPLPGVTREPNRVSFGRAEPTVLTPRTPGIDDDLRLSLTTDQEHRFLALDFTCSFRPDDDPLVEARLVVRLINQPPAEGVHPPMAWSLQPDRLIQPFGRQVGFSLKPKLTAVSAVTVEGIGVSSQDNLDVQECYLVANGKRTSTADWFFRATKSVALEGMHDLRLIARVKRRVPALAEVMMTAKIRRRSAGLVAYRAALPEQLQAIPLQVLETFT